MQQPPLILAPPEKIRLLAELRERKRQLEARSRRQWKTPGELAKAIDKGTVQTPALDVIDEAVCQAYTTRDARLIISMPPQEGKSERVTKTGSLWALIRDPELRLGIVSYSQSLAETFGRSVRNWIATLNGDDGTLDLGLRIAQDYGSAKRWQLDGHRGGVICAGVGSGITGRPLDALVIDDPFSGRDEADSEYYRKRVWDWWTSSGSTRLAPGAPVIVILTRWHEDDLAGRLVAAEDGDRWQVINIPALADHDPAKGQSDPLGRKPGEWLTSARGRTPEDWERIRVQAGSRDFTSLYQGRPSPDQGAVWKRQWWRRYREPLWSQHPDVPAAYLVRDMDEVLMSWDMAFKDTKSSDYVVGQVWARRGADAFLLDQVHKRLSFTDTLTAFTTLCVRWPQATRRLVEDKANGTAVISTLKSKIPGLVAVNPTDSKYGRAVAVAPMVEAGNVLLPDPSIALFDTEAFVDECAAFPNGAHDDQVDTTSQALAVMFLDGSGAAAWLAWAKRKAEEAAAARGGQPGRETAAGAAGPAAAPEAEAPAVPDPAAARKAARDAAFRAANRLPESTSAASSQVTSVPGSNSRRPRRSRGGQRMGVRSVIGNTLVRVGKTFGGSVPPQVEAAENAQQMPMSSPFAPGEPIPPFDGYSRQPRTREFTPGYNIATRPRLHERVSFDTLTGLIDAYDIAQMCIWHRIDTLRSVKWRLVAADGYAGDVSGAVELGKKVLRKPDRRHYFKNWFAKWMYDVLAYDAGTLYRLRNRGGKCIGLMPVDGTTIAPLLDYWGNEPEPPAESHVQYVNGLPWNWLTRDDLIYEPMRGVNKSVYGKAPIESIILNANTDIRFQLHFLQRFTEGNIPEAFASAPESWSPDQIENFQAYWDSFMYGDQSRKHQIRWMPGGSSISWTNEKDFSDQFSLFMMRKTCATYHVVPTDLGFTDSANYSTGESQADVAHKVGELPLDEYSEEILSQFLYDDLQLPLKFEWDRGEDQDDRLVQAQADDIYIKNGTVGTEDIREMRYGLPKSARPVPRFIFTERGGPIPLNALMGVGGEIDPETGAPTANAELPRTAFSEVEGVESQPPVLGTPLAVQEYGPQALPPAPPEQPLPPENADAPVAKEGESTGTAGITSDTGIYGYDLEHGKDEDEDREKVAKSELAAFRRYARARRKAGEWRDFRFTAVGKVEAHRLNDAGRLAVRKAAGQVAVAGLAVLAADTGRVLMLQRALCDDDPAAGTWEFPGGHLEGDESPLAAAWREWQEETGSPCAPGVQTGTWTSGIYQGIVWTIDCEAMVPVRSDSVITNPDDPDGDQVEAIAWWDPAMLPGNPAVRPELLADIGTVMAALGCETDDCCGAECCAGGCCNGDGGCQCGPSEVAKAGDGGNPKGRGPAGR